MELVGEFSLSDEEKSALQRFLKQIDEKDLVGVKVLPNRELLACEENGSLPRGVALYLRADAPVDPTLISDNHFESLAVVNIPGETRKDKHYSRQLRQIDAAIPHEAPLDLRFCKEAVGSGSVMDAAPWAAELSAKDSFAGIFAWIDPNDPRVRSHAIVSRGSVPHFVQDMKEECADSVTDKSVTWSKLADSTTHAQGLYGAKQTVLRNANNVADAVGISISRGDEKTAFVGSPNIAPPEFAKPTHFFTTHNLLQTGSNVVQLTFDAVPARECITRKLYVVGAPNDGIAIYHVAKDAYVKSDGVFPASTGRSAGARAERVPISSSVFVGASTSDSFRPLSDAEFKKSMQKVGWTMENQVERLIPVAVKVAQ